MLGIRRGEASSRILPTFRSRRICPGRRARRRLLVRHRAEQILAALGPAQQHDHAAALGGHDAHRLVDAEGVTAAGAVQEVEHRDRLVHPHQGLHLGLDLALHQRQVHVAADLVGVGAQAEGAVVALHLLLGDLLDQAL